MEKQVGFYQVQKRIRTFQKQRQKDNTLVRGNILESEQFNWFFKNKTPWALVIQQVFRFAFLAKMLVKVGPVPVIEQQLPHTYA